MVDSGGSRPQVGAATSQLGSDPVRLEEPPSEVSVALEWVPAWEPVAESAPTIPTLAEKQIPTVSTLFCFLTPHHYTHKGAQSMLSTAQDAPWVK